MSQISPWNYAECRYVECRYAECHYAECHYAECRCAKCCGATLLTSFRQNYLSQFNFFKLSKTLPFDIIIIKF